MYMFVLVVYLNGGVDGLNQYMNREDCLRAMIDMNSMTTPGSSRQYFLNEYPDKPDFACYDFKTRKFFTS